MKFAARPVSPELNDAVLACRYHLLAAGAFSLGLNLLYLAVPIYTMQLYDRILPSGSESTLVLLTLAAFVALGVLAGLDALRAQVLTRMGVRVERGLAARVLDVTIERSLALGPAERGQGLRDLEILRQSLSSPAVLALFDLPWIPIYVATLFLIHWALGMFALLCGAVLVGLALVQHRVTRATAARAQDAAIVNYAFTDASLRNADVIRALGMFSDFLKRWERDRLAMVRSQLAGNERSAVIASAIKFMRLLAQVLVLGAAAYLAIRQVVTPGAIFAAAILLARAMQPVEQVVGSWRQLIAAFAAHRRVAAILVQYPLAANKLELPRPTGQVSVAQATFVPPSGSRPVVYGLTFRLEAGESLGVIGPTAAGKSTLARLLVGVYPPTGGEVRIDGANAFAWARASLGRYVGYLPQDVELFPGTVAENIARFGEIDSEAVIAAAQLAGMHEAILALPRGYETMIGGHRMALSGGQKQLIAVARAVYRMPNLVVLDEPNSHLDSSGDAKLAECLERLKQARSTTVVISHRISTLHTVDRILCLQDGRMVGFGPRSEIMARLSRLSAVAGARGGES